MKKIPFACAMFAALLSVPSAPGEEPPELPPLRQKYERQAAVSLTPVLQGYIRELEALAQRPRPGRSTSDQEAIQNELARQKQRLNGAAQAGFLGAPVDAESRNAVRNPGFEKGLDGWFVWGGDPSVPALAKEAQDSHTGRAYVRIKRDDAADTAILLQDLADALKHGDRVHASAWFRRSPNSRGEASFGVILKDAADKRIIQAIAWPVRATGRWEKCTLDFVVPTRDQAPDLAKIQLVCILKGKGDTGELCIDDVFAGAIPTGP